MGKRPNYFVPISPKSSPLAVIGCARLGVSDKRVEFSANAEPIGGKNYLCLNPAYRGRGQLGIYIPASCTRNPVSRRLAVISVELPRQAVRGYGLVVWGTSGASTEGVVARYGSDEAAAAVFTVMPPLASRVGAIGPFSAFVVELPSQAACKSILVGAQGRSGPMTERVGARPKLCHPA